MTFYPHIKNGYYLPFHGDEWVHWAFTRAFMENGTIKFVNPFTGKGEILNPEIGFHIFLSSFKWLSMSRLKSIFVFMPSIIAVFTAITAFCIGERAKKKFGLEAAFMIAFIPTTVRILGPSFLVPVSLGLFLILFTLWLLQNEGKAKYPILLFLLLFAIFMHLPSAAAIVIVAFSYAITTSIEKNYREGIAIAIISVASIIF